MLCLKSFVTFLKMIIKYFKEFFLNILEIKVIDNTVDVCRLINIFRSIPFRTQLFKSSQCYVWKIDCNDTLVNNSLRLSLHRIFYVARFGRMTNLSSYWVTFIAHSRYTFYIYSIRTKYIIWIKLLILAIQNNISFFKPFFSTYFWKRSIQARMTSIICVP